MSWDGLLIAGLAASAGALAGVVFSWLLSPLLKRGGSAVRNGASSLIVIGGAILGYAFLSSPIEPLVQARLGNSAGIAGGQNEGSFVKIEPEISAADVNAAVEGAIDDLNDPFLEAVLEREPNRAEQLHTRLGAAYRRGGEQALLSALLQAEQDIMKVSLPYYMARATDEDLLAAVRKIRDVINVLGQNDPMTCHAWLYGAYSGEPFDFDRYMAAVGPEEHLALQTLLGEAVANANEILPEYDEEYAMIVLDEVRIALNNRLGNEKIGLIMAAQLPETEDDARLACEASADYYDLILAEEKPVDVFRHRYLGGGEIY